MKKYLKFSLFVLSFLFVFVITTVAQSVDTVSEDVNFLMEFLSSNIEAIGVIVSWLVIRLIPTKWKDPVMMIVNWLISLVPDRKSGGGKHV